MRDRGREGKLERVSEAVRKWRCILANQMTETCSALIRRNLGAQLLYLSEEMKKKGVKDKKKKENWLFANIPRGIYNFSLREGYMCLFEEESSCSTSCSMEEHTANWHSNYNWERFLMTCIFFTKVCNSAHPLSSSIWIHILLLITSEEVEFSPPCVSLEVELLPEDCWNGTKWPFQVVCSLLTNTEICSN